jgi:hypothetical protein
VSIGAIALGTYLQFQTYYKELKMILTNYYELIERNYVQHGNWYLKGTISINLLSGTVKVHGKVILEDCATLIHKLDIDKVELLDSLITTIRASAK